MSIIHKTTMSPTKLELLTPWLPQQPWYAAARRPPELSRVGGFRLDDPEGEVGIEFMVVRDDAGDRPAWYHVPMTYRAAPLDGAERALIGTTEHGVLGQRWIYDGPHDPVLVAQLIALLQGRAEPQAQSQSHTPDPSVTAEVTGSGLDVPAGAAGAPAVANGPDGTRLLLGDGGPVLRVTRVLRPEPGAESGAESGVESGPESTGARGHVSAGWRLSEGGEARGRYVVLYDGDTVS
ncbi:maltokinase N-terminal cap-like domain-containing protein [Streptomyces javensis]|uniref:1,4-alpha-glucan branching protein n=1 Tax=Streptomyces javensis TaxID=114698 RepID=A0ABS0RME6_9ACTN|nr:1,4-alpha-glucan branching protein [Streptomyces javensis]MBI0318523.1 1,4-alpha-glucan branching protein [Streptomyces javensis]